MNPRQPIAHALRDGSPLSRLHRGRPLRWTVIALTVAMCAITLVWIYPFLWMFSASFKTPIEIFRKGLSLIPDSVTLDSYIRAWVTARFSQYMLNTVVISVGTVLLVIARTGMAGYALGRFAFPGRAIVLGLFVATIIIPAGYTIIPIVRLTNALGLLNTRLGIVLALGAGGHVPSLLLFMGYFHKVPKELEEVAFLDGAGFLTIFLRIMLPLAKPVIATVSILTFLFSWNSFFVPLVFTFSRPSLRTLAVGMLAFSSVHETDWSGMAAAATISLLPVMIVFLIMQRHFIEGISGAVKE